MVRSIPRSLVWLALALATAWLSLIAAPRRVTGQDTSVGRRSYFSSMQAPVELSPEEPAPPAFVEPPLESVGVIGTAQAPNYWIVSSRCDIQHRRHLHLDDGDLDVFQRTPDGQLHRANLGSLQACMIPGVPALVSIHGSFVSWQDECYESYQAYQWIRNACPELPLQVIFFTWPSEGLITGLLPADVAIKGKQAEFNGFHLARMLNCVPESCPVSFIGHSFGCRVILSTLHLAGGGDVQGMNYPGGMTAHRYRAVFAAAAVDHNWLNPGERYGCALPRTECILNLRNRRDFPLAFYPLHRPFAGRALARSGLTRRDTRKLGVESEKVINLDVTHIQGHNHLWPGYFQSSEIAAAIAPVIYFPESNAPMRTPVSGIPSAPRAEPVEESVVAPVPTDYAPSENDAPTYNPPVDDFSTPTAPQLVPNVP